MTEDMHNHLFPPDPEPVENLDVHTELRFSRKNLPKGEMVPVIVDGKKEYVLIPLDIKNGTTLPVVGGGKHNPRTGKTGNLYVLVHIEEQTIPWKRILIAVTLFAIILMLCVLLMRKNDISGPPPTTEATGTCSHIWIPANCTDAKICSECGETVGKATGHKWIEATCDSPKICKVCGDVSGTALDHQWKAATCTEPKTCKICGITTGSAAGHDWTEATFSSPKTCITCGETSGNILRVDPYSVELPDLSSFFRHKYTENMWGEAHLVTTVCDPEYLQSGFEEYLQLLLDEKYQLELMETRENRSSVDYIFRYTGENDEIEWIEHKNGYSYHVKLTIYENKNAISLHTHPEFVLVDSGSTASHIS